MAFDSYLIKIYDKNSSSNGWQIPMKYIKADTYVALLSGQDLDSYRDADGKLHRTALKNVAPKVEFEIPPMTNKDLDTFMSNLRNRYTNTTEKKVKAKVYMPEINNYIEHEFYVPDINFTMYKIEGREILYNSTRVAFISYGGEVKTS